jgi:hypothetical protein
VRDSHIRRAMQCPHPGCDAWAIVASPDTTTDDAAHLWSCGDGHHGPRITGTVR